MVPSAGRAVRTRTRRSPDSGGRRDKSSCRGVVIIDFGILCLMPEPKDSRILNPFRQSDMATYYAKRALEILREEGPVELSKRSKRFIFRQPLKRLDPQYHRRFKYHTWKNHLQNRIKYDAPPDPYQPIYIIGTSQPA